jgi:hypothetical protein
MDELLRILQSNALESREDIARMLGVPAAEVSQRIAEYEKPSSMRTNSTWRRSPRSSR